ncbi:phytanoyl-CoA dioxygenase family protein [bacterium]|nr:MAG: phytanoyl-CoA dioxygenase family protein [bacterium]
MLTAEQVEKFRRDGFLLGPQVLSEAEIQELQEETLRVIADREDASKPQPVLCHNMTNNPDKAVWQIVDIYRASEPFRRLVENPTIAEEIAQLSGGQEIRLWHDQIQYKPAAIGGANHWHQDAPYWPPLTPKDAQVTAWVALDDVDDENGCMRMVPGSHLWGTHIRWLEALENFDAMPSTFGGQPIEVKVCPVRRGQVHYHHSLTWHGSGANRSGRPRRAIALHYMTERTRYASGEKDHVKTKLIGVEPGSPIAGADFPQVWPR